MPPWESTRGEREGAACTKGTKPSLGAPNCNNKPWTRRTSNLAAFRPILLLFLPSPSPTTPAPFSGDARRPLFASAAGQRRNHPFSSLQRAVTADHHPISLAPKLRPFGNETHDCNRDQLTRPPRPCDQLEQYPLLITVAGRSPGGLFPKIPNLTRLDNLSGFQLQTKSRAISSKPPLKGRPRAQEHLDNKSWGY